MIAKNVELIEYSKKVDFGNCITHALGAVLSVGAMLAMLIKAQDIRHTLSAVIYGAALIAVYTVSAAYHGLKSGEAKRIARLIDHSTVPVLIAGTATPCALITLYEISAAHSIFVLLLGWLCTLFGFFSKIFFFEKLKAVTIAVYIVSCLAMILSVFPIIGEINATAFRGILLGNAAYLLGAVFCGRGRKREVLHVVFHIFVLAAAAIHFYVIYNYMFI